MFPLRSWLDNIDTFGYFDKGVYSIVLPTGEAVFNWDAVDYCLRFKDKLGNMIFTNDRVFVENYPYIIPQVFVSTDLEQQKKGFYATVKYDKITGAFYLHGDTGEFHQITAYTAKYTTVVGNIYKGG